MTATRGSVGRRDVSADRALTDSGDVFRRLASSSPIGILLFDTEGRLTFANERWRETVGIGSDEPVSDFDWIEFIHPEDCEEVVGTARHTSAGDGIADLEFRFVRRDGQLRWSRTRSAAVCDLNGEVRGFVATCEDITAEREAAETRHRLTQALETTPDYVVVLEADGRVVYANETVREEAALHGRVDLGALAAPSTFTAESWTTIVHEAWPALCEKGSWQGELTAVRRDGTPVPVILSARAHRSDDGEVVYVSAIARDISDIKRFEQQLAKSEALFRALVER
ncbi:MAG: PAS domain-containing protein, partial [Acidimicrobiia bacterium]